MSQPIRVAAMEIVEREEIANGFSPHVLGVATLEKREGCDIVSTSPEGVRHRVEVKGWGAPFLSATGQFRFTQDIRESQMQAAKLDEPYRVEIVANLTEHLRSGAPYERLTLTATDVKAATPRLWEIDLTGKKADIRRAAAEDE